MPVTKLGHKGPDLLEYCKRGHLMSETRKRHPNGGTYCSKCGSDRTKSFGKDRPGYWESNNRRQQLKRFDLTIEDYDKLYKLQNGCCAICNKHSDEFGKNHAVDHDHKTGKIRGLLCLHCNTALGHLREDLNIISKAYEYLVKSNEQPIYNTEECLVCQ